MRLGLLGRAFLRRDLAADAVDGGLLGRDLAARGIDRDAIVAVVDPEDHVAGAHHGVVAGKDRRDVAGHPRAERGVVGAHIGVVGRDVEAADQNVVHAVAGGGEREQRDRRPSEPVCACPISARRLAATAGAPAGLSVAGQPALRRSGAQRLSETWERGWSAELRKRRARTAFRRIRLRHEGYVRPGLSLRPLRPPHCNRAMPAQPKTGRAASSDSEINIDRTVRSRYINIDRTIQCGFPSAAYPTREIFPEKLNQWLQPSPPALHLVGDEDSSKRRQILDGARKVFMDLGFDGASMGEIARSAGVSKGTLYVYFADKSRLFEAIVEEESLEQGKVAFNFDPERDVDRPR